MLVGYARVSTSDQEHALQIDALQQAGCEKIFTETASGSHRRRPQLKAALDYASEGDTLVVWKIDRLSRSVVDLILMVDSLGKRDIGFRSLTDPFDTTTPAGRLQFHLLGAMAEYERRMIQQRTKAGLEAARARGRVGGRPKSFTPEKMNLARERLADGVSIKNLAKELGVSSRTLYTYFPRGQVRESPRERIGVE